MAGWLHGVFVGEWRFVFPLCGFFLSLFCNYILTVLEDLHLTAADRDRHFEEYFNCQTRPRYNTP